jgi:hypothetical protein
MSKHKANLDPERLIEAAEASLLAAVETADDAGGPCPYPADLMGSSSQPECLAPFTKWEIQEACQFLVRLGVLDRPRAKRAA